MQQYSLEVTHNIPDDAVKTLGQGLDAYGEEQCGVSDRQPLAVLVRDPLSGKVVGGMTGRTSLGLMFIDLFYLPAELRGAGLGSAILQQFEQEGRQRGCSSGVLYTISFQAPAFYERHGWSRFGEIPCSPEGTSRIFMTKKL